MGVSYFPPVSTGGGGSLGADQMLMLALLSPNGTTVLRNATATVGAALDNIAQLDGQASNPTLRAQPTLKAVLGNTTAFAAAAASATVKGVFPLFNLYNATIGQSMFGGFYAGIMDTTVGNIISQDAYQSGQRYALIMSPVSLDTSEVWLSSGQLVAGCETRWDGKSATHALNSAGTSAAASYALGLSYPTSDGGSEWYIPALDEMELLYRNFKPTTESNYTTATSAGTFPSTVLAQGTNPSSSPTGAAYTTSAPAQTSLAAFQGGGANSLQGTSGSDVYYWTSTVYSSTLAWTQLVSGSFAGRQSNGGQSGSYRVRPVRRVVL